jgi:hypothetical protein
VGTLANVLTADKHQYETSISPEAWANVLEAALLLLGLTTQIFKAVDSSELLASMLSHNEITQKVFVLVDWYVCTALPSSLPTHQAPELARAVASLKCAFEELLAHLSQHAVTSTYVRCLSSLLQNPLLI